jgi:hypothetical protein
MIQIKNNDTNKKCSEKTVEFRSGFRLHKIHFTVIPRSLAHSVKQSKHTETSKFPSRQNFKKSLVQSWLAATSSTILKNPQTGHKIFKTRCLTITRLLHKRLTNANLMAKTKQKVCKLYEGNADRLNTL